MKTEEEVLAEKMAHYNREDRPTPLPYPEMFKVRFSDDEKTFIYQAMIEYADQFKPKWISANENLPEIGVEVLTFGKDGLQVAELVGPQKWKVFFNAAEDVEIYFPHYWMPLPTKP